MIKPRRYVPESLGEISDYIGAMILAIPKSVDRIADGGVDGAFLTLAECMMLARKRIGDEAYAQIVELAAESHELFQLGSFKEGRKRLFEIDELYHAALREKK